MKLEMYEDEDFVWYELDGELHRANGPAEISIDGLDWCWWLNGKKHRYYGTYNPIRIPWCIHGEEVK